MLQFSSKSLFIVTAWVAVISMGMRFLANEFLIPRLYCFNAAIVMAGAMAGTIYGVVLKRGGHNRWLRAFVIGIMFGATHLAWFNGPVGYVLFYVTFVYLIVYAFVAATLTELLRLLLVAVES